ncbi:sensor histidine kinase [uncultured Friedmanniella sp.]|uniref:sensor histidine kinase n=1 Tax=uncultured Friedmanniella sp. TaxID=335381 RepID=UPI0035CBFB5B
MSRWSHASRNLSLRARLVIGVVGLLAVGLTLANVAAVRLIGTYLNQRIDQQLNIPQRGSAAPFGAAGTTAQLCGLLGQGDFGTQQLPTSYALVVTDLDGTILCQVPHAPQALDRPDVSALAGRLGTAVASQEPLTVAGVDQHAPWRVRVTATSGGYLVLGISLADSVDTLRRLQLITLLVSLVILLLAGLGSWYVVRFALRPLTTIEHTARAIADGDLSQRLETPPANTEIGRLTRSLNVMLSQIEQGFDDRIATEERLRRFIADASHELRTPLASIRGHAEMYRQGVAATPQDVTVIMSRVESESIRMGDLVNDLLQLAQLDDAPQLDRRPVDLLAVAADTVADARARDPGRAVRLTQLEGPGWVDAPPVVVGDEGGLRQVLGNVVANVLRHTPDGTPYEIAVGVGEDGVQARVVDHGPGLSPDAAAKVFERFYRLDYGRSRHQGGAGLGLSIAAGLMAAHGGTLIHAATPGGGSTFILAFPVEPVEPVAPVPPVAPGEAPGAVGSAGSAPGEQ